MKSKRARNTRKKFLGNHSSLLGENWKYQLDACLLFSLCFHSDSLHSIYNCLGFDSIRFDKIDVLGMQRGLRVTIYCCWGIKYKDH